MDDASGHCMKSNWPSLVDASCDWPQQEPRGPRESVDCRCDPPIVSGAVRGMELAAALLRQLFRCYPESMAVRLWNGDRLSVGAAIPARSTEAPFVLVLRHPEVIAAMVLGGGLCLAEAYCRGDADIEGDFYAALRLKNHLQTLQIPLRERPTALLQALRLRALNPRPAAAFGEHVPRRGSEVRDHSKQENRAANRFHYDISNDFYRLWLGQSLVYSCAYFDEPGDRLEKAQDAKLDHVCRKLLLRPNQRFLDIGCGWGALLIHAASQYGVYAHGITLSEKQLSVARQRIDEAGLEDRVTVELKDYRDLPRDSFDKVASVGLYEHVGLKNLPAYFATVHRALRSGGLFLNEGVTHEPGGWNKNSSTQFVNRYVFPDAQLDCAGNLLTLMERAQFEIEEVESLRSHLALTVRAWVDRLEHRYDEVLECVSEATFRVWRLYLAACALELDCGNLGVYQVLVSKRGSARIAELAQRGAS